MVKAILTDIEGTTSSISFVKDVLFPYAKEKMGEFVKKNKDNLEVNRILKEVEKAVGKKLTIDETINILKKWIEEDKKITPLKEIQGLIWEEGYKTGELQGHIYDDSFEKLKKLKEKGIPIYVYSSGSVKAQKLLFSNTKFGDINYLFSGYFDTKIGGKKEAESYKKIASEIGLKPEEILFLSDNIDEIKAASKAGMKVIRFAREGEFEVIPDFPFKQVRSFDEIEIE
jgi:enolase-phosphatase E1